MSAPINDNRPTPTTGDVDSSRLSTGVASLMRTLKEIPTSFVGMSGSDRKAKIVFELFQVVSAAFGMYYMNQERTKYKDEKIKYDNLNSRHHETIDENTRLQLDNSSLIKQKLSLLREMIVDDIKRHPNYDTWYEQRNVKALGDEITWHLENFSNDEDLRTIEETERLWDELTKTTNKRKSAAAGFPNAFETSKKRKTGRPFTPAKIPPSQARSPLDQTIKSSGMLDRAVRDAFGHGGDSSRSALAASFSTVESSPLAAKSRQGYYASSQPPLPTREEREASVPAGPSQPLQIKNATGAKRSARAADVSTPIRQTIEVEEREVHEHSSSGKEGSEGLGLSFSDDSDGLVVNRKHQSEGKYSRTDFLVSGALPFEGQAGAHSKSKNDDGDEIMEDALFVEAASSQNSKKDLPKGTRDRGKSRVSFAPGTKRQKKINKDTPGVPPADEKEGTAEDEKFLLTGNAPSKSTLVKAKAPVSSAPKTKHHRKTDVDRSYHPPKDAKEDDDEEDQLAASTGSSRKSSRKGKSRVSSLPKAKQEEQTDEDTSHADHAAVEIDVPASTTVRRSPWGKKIHETARRSERIRSRTPSAQPEEYTGKGKGKARQ